MFETLALVLLALAFGVLLWTFVWMAKLFTQRAEVKERAKKKAVTKEQTAAELAGEEEKEDEEPEMVRGPGYGANYGLLLGGLSCGFFWLSPLVLALSFVGGFYSVRAITNGIRHFRMLVWRALFGLVLNVGGIALQFSSMLGIIPPLV
jgi:protein-S-isoprenylcysteine O-methyltransferase Ste14